MKEIDVTFIGPDIIMRMEMSDAKSCKLTIKDTHSGESKSEDIPVEIAGWISCLFIAGEESAFANEMYNVKLDDETIDDLLNRLGFIKGLRPIP